MQDVINRALTINKDGQMLGVELEAIYKMCKEHYKGGHTLEIGAYKGMTSYIMASIIRDNPHVPNSKHFIFDIFDNQKGETGFNYDIHTRQMLVDNLKDLEDFIEVTEGLSLSYESTFKIFQNHFDYVFIDGDHRYPVVLMELLMCEINCDHIMGHDYGWPGVSQSVDQFCKLRGYKVQQPMVGGYGLFELVKE